MALGNGGGAVFERESLRVQCEDLCVVGTLRCTLRAHSSTIG